MTVPCDHTVAPDAVFFYKNISYQIWFNPYHPSANDINKLFKKSNLVVKGKLTEALTGWGTCTVLVTGAHTKFSEKTCSCSNFSDQWYGQGRPYGPIVPITPQNIKVNMNFDRRCYGTVPCDRSYPEIAHFHHKNTRKEKTRITNSKQFLLL
jgi:hypothetical protein